MKYRDLSKPAKRALSYKPFIAYRLADTYILGAEAHWRKGNTEKALEYLNAIRLRAGLEEATTIDLQAIMDEYARELCFEGKRWFFLKRIGKLVEQVNKYHRFGSTTSSIQGYHNERLYGALADPAGTNRCNGNFPTESAILNEYENSNHTLVISFCFFSAVCPVW